MASAEEEITEVESLCLRCRENGITKFLLIKIPHFKDVVISAFECPHCGESNNGVQSAASIAAKGKIQTLHASLPEDLDRQIVKSEFAAVKISEIDLEIPIRSGKGVLTTVEGLLKSIIEDLGAEQEYRKSADFETYTKLEKLIDEMNSFLACKRPFTLVMDDVTGNSYIEKLCFPNIDPRLEEKEYAQETSRLAELGFAVENEDQDLVPEEVYAFQGLCPSCSHKCDTRMKMIDIPYFKEVVIMATVCDNCGYKTNEVKSGGAIPPHGTKLTLTSISIDDLSRDILKSETCVLKIPEIDLELGTGTLGGRFTTIEGLIIQIREELASKIPFSSGDSVDVTKKKVLDKLITKLDSVLEDGKFTLILDDPLSGSYIQNIYAPDNDPNLLSEQYERSFEQNEDFGLNDIKVEDY